MKLELRYILERLNYVQKLRYSIGFFLVTLDCNQNMIKKLLCNLLVGHVQNLKCKFNSLSNTHFVL